MRKLLLERIKKVFLGNLPAPRQQWRVRYVTLDGKEEFWTTPYYYAAVDFCRIFTKGASVPERVRD